MNNTVNTVSGQICRASNWLTWVMDLLSNVAVLAIRIYLAYVFLWSAWLKVTSWSSTVYMFSHEFKTGFFPPLMAAYVGTVAEILFPALLLIGLGARIPALCLFTFNLISVVSYPILLDPQYFCALKDHILWGVLILVPAFYGHGVFSVDYLVKKFVCKEYKY